MAKSELADGRFPDAKALAQSITDSQWQEIGMMKGMLATR